MTSSAADTVKVGREMETVAAEELSSAMSAPSPVHDDHDYFCCRGGSTATAPASKGHQNRRTTTTTSVQSDAASGAPPSRSAATSSRELNTFWKMGHGGDSRRKLCIVGFNWNSSQLRLNKLHGSSAGGKTAAATCSVAAAEGQLKPRNKSLTSKIVLNNCESRVVVAETAKQIVSGAAGDRPEVVKDAVAHQPMNGGAKRRPKSAASYLYESTATAADDRPTAGKPVALANKSAGRKSGTGSGNSSIADDDDETSAAVRSIMYSAECDVYRMPDACVSVPPGAARNNRTTAGEYTFQLSSTSTKQKLSSPPDCAYLSAFLREPGTGGMTGSDGCEAVSAGAATPVQMLDGPVQISTSSSSAQQSAATAPLGIPSPFLLQTGLEQALGFAAFHPMSPSTSSSSCSRVAADADDCTNYDDEQLSLPLTADVKYRLPLSHCSYMQDRPARSVSFGYSQDNANQ